MTSPRRTPRLGTTLLGTALLGTALLGTALLGPLLGCTGAGAQDGLAPDLWVVKRGDRPITVTEEAEIQPLSSTQIKNEMEGHSTIIYLIDEGKVVQKGEKLVELDASDLLERKAQQGITLHRADAARLEARKELEIRKKQAVAEQLGAKNRLRIANIDLEKFLGKDLGDGKRGMGERQQQLVAAEANIKLARQELKLAENKLVWSEKLYQKGFITKDEYERDQIDRDRNQNNVLVAENQLDILRDFTHPKELISLGQAIREAETDVESTDAQNQARIAQATADLESKEKEYDLALERYQNLEKQIKNSVIRAPAPGLVVYAVSDGRRGQNDFIEEGAEVRERQTLIMLPDVTRMVAKIKVHEAVVDKVHPGQPARIRVEAFPDREFRGFVRRVSPVADSGSRWSNNTLKVYKTDVEISGENEVLKPGMTAEATIIIADLKNVIYAPLPAVLRQGSVTYVWKAVGGEPVAQKIEVGLHDRQYVEVTEGLAEGDEIFLAPPPGAVAPKFPQPKVPTVADTLRGDEIATQTPAQDGDGGSPRRRGRPEPGPAAKRFSELLRAKHPDLADRIEADRSAMRDEDVRTAIDADPDLKEAQAAMMSEMRGRLWGGGGGRGRSGANGPRNGGRGGEGPGKGDGAGHRGGGRPAEEGR